MSVDDRDVAVALAEAEAAKARLFGTLGRMQTRLKPANLAQDAVESAANGVAGVARKGVAVVRSRPLAAAGIAGLVGLVLARGWIGKRIAGGDETQRGDTGLKTKAVRRATKGPSK